MCKGNCGECVCGKNDIEGAIHDTPPVSNVFTQGSLERAKPTGTDDECIEAALRGHSRVFTHVDTLAFQRPDFIVNSIDVNGNANISWITGHDADDDTEVVAISTDMAKAIGMPEDESNNYEVPVTTLVQTLNGKMTPIQEIESPSHVMSPYMNPAAMGLGVHEVCEMYPDRSVVNAYALDFVLDNEGLNKISPVQTNSDIGRGLTNPIIIGDHNIDTFVGQDTLEEIHSGNLHITSSVPDVTLGGCDSDINLAYNGEGIPSKTPFVQARELMAASILDDPSLHITYQSMVAMHLSDRYGITDHDTRNQCASELLEMIFRGK